MEYQRYYPGSARFPDGRILITSGEDADENLPETDPAHKWYVDEPEMYTPPQKGDSTSQGYFSELPSSADLNMNVDYPFTVVSPYDGNLLFLGPQGYKADGTTTVGPLPQKLDTLALTWSSYGTDATSNICRKAGTYAGSGVMINGKFYKAGGFDYDFQNQPSNDTARLNCNVASPTWEDLGKFEDNERRGYHYLVGLADASVLAIGGQTVDQFGAVIPARYPQLFKPFETNPTWQKLTPYSSTYADHKYHSVAYLLIDGTVLLSGGQDRNTSDKYVIFTPPYLEGSPTRPIINSDVAELKQNTSYTIDASPASGKEITKFTLCALPAPTHAVDNKQRVVSLDCTMNQNFFGNGYVINMPNANVLPPGWYMLFAIQDDGVPSYGQYVRVWDGYERSYPTGASRNEGGSETAPTNSLIMGDNSYYEIPAAPYGINDYRATVEVKAVASLTSSLTAIRLKTEAYRTGVTSANQTVTFYNYSTLAWDSVGSSQSVGASDGRLTYTKTGTSTALANYIGTWYNVPNTIRARVKMADTQSTSFGTAKWDVIELGFKQ